jgi:hypothetical protein
MKDLSRLFLLEIHAITTKTSLTDFLKTILGAHFEICFDSRCQWLLITDLPVTVKAHFP